MKSKSLVEMPVETYNELLARDKENQIIAEKLAQRIEADRERRRVQSAAIESAIKSSLDQVRTTYDEVLGHCPNCRHTVTALVPKPAPLTFRQALSALWAALWRR